MDTMIKNIENVLIELKYQEYCLTFSYAYLSGCDWYNYINKYGGGSFIKAHDHSLLNDFLNNI